MYLVESYVALSAEEVNRLAKIYAKDAVKCEAEGRTTHALVYSGTAVLADGRKQRSHEYRCSACGEFIRKEDLQEQTQYA